MVKTSMLYALKSSGISDKGLLRQNNEDVWGQNSDKRCYLIADGMGGHQAGEIASQLAVDTILNVVKSHWNPSEIDLNEAQEFVFQAFQKANQNVYIHGNSNPEWHGMGTTVCCLLFHPEGVVYAHVGDSRIYYLRNGKLYQLTKDHSLIKERENQGLSIEGNQYKHVLTKAIGTEPLIAPTCATMSIEPGDLFLMCTDGLTDLLTNSEIEYILNHTPFDNLPTHFVEIAKERGAHDNITLVVVKIHEPNLS